MARWPVLSGLSRRGLAGLGAGILIIGAAIAVIVGAAGSPVPRLPADAGSNTPGSGEVSRWWSTSESEVGSTVEAGDADDATKVLAPDRGAYCQALADTMAAGNSIFPADIDVGSPAYLGAVTTFVREMQAMAPGEVSAQWRVLGDTILAVVESEGDATRLVLPDGVTAESVQAASDAVGANAQEACGLAIQ
jgi:hypothetical protein